MSDNIHLLCEIQNLLYQTNCMNKINLPQIIVIGPQSSGKSSVLDLIIGEDILPSGQGIVTKKPIIIQKQQDSSIDRPYGEIMNIGNKKYYNFKELKSELFLQMQKVPKNSISSEPVVIKLVFKECIELTLIDMPGLTKIAIGNQSKDLPIQIENIVKTYIQNPNSIILAISPGNIDIANSDALKLSKEVDPEGERTLGVISKMDLISDFENIKFLLEGKINLLKLGYCGVYCRNQNDINGGLSIMQAKKREEVFFNKHQELSYLSKYLGTSNLEDKLNKILLKTMKKNLPIIKSKIQNLINEKENIVRDFSNLNELNNQEPSHGLLITLINKFVDKFHQTLKGDMINISKIQNEFFGGAKINYIIDNVFKKKLDKIENLEGVKDQDIFWLSKNTNSFNQNMFYSNIAFEKITKMQILKLKDSCNDTVYSVHSEILDILKNIKIPEFDVFGNLRIEIMRSIEVATKNYLKNTIDMINNLIKIEHGFINQKNNIFESKKGLIINGNNKEDHNKNSKDTGEGFWSFFSRKDNNTNNSFNPSRSDKEEIIITKKLINLYINIVKNNLADMVPKSIMTFLLEEITSNLSKNLINELLKQNIKILLNKNNLKMNDFKKNEFELNKLKKTMDLIDIVNLNY